ncbi:MAG: restriction endonuclease subunit S [Clostridia bacterium]|nr:restriction endonuclease subunit S [Clostridia bacterium]
MVVRYSWEQRKLGDIVGIYDGVHQTPNYQNSGVMFLSVENIATLKSSKFISEEDFKRDYKVFPQENDILMTRIGDVGTTNVVTDNGLKAYYVSLALLKYKSTDPYFLSNAIQSDYIQKGLANRTLKTAIPMKINKDEIGKVSVMLPLSATEQQQIGTCFRNLDNLITLHQRKLELRFFPGCMFFIWVCMLTWCPATKEQGIGGSEAPRPTGRSPILSQRRGARRRKNKALRGAKHHAQPAEIRFCPKDMVPSDERTRHWGERSTTPNRPKPHFVPKTWCPTTEEQGVAGSEAPRSTGRTPIWSQRRGARRRRTRFCRQHYPDIKGGNYDF